ncbi:hypothetical protein MBLNU230_g5343t1 [Neophaeotheca triangularis]
MADDNPAPAPKKRGRPPKRKAGSPEPESRFKRVRPISETNALIDTNAPVERRGRGRPKKLDHLLKHPRRDAKVEAVADIPPPKTPVLDEHDEGEEEEERGEENATSLPGELAPNIAAKRPRGRPRKNGQPPRPRQIAMKDEAALLAPGPVAKQKPGRPRKISQTLNISRLNGRPPAPVAVPTPTPEHTLKTVDSSQTPRNDSNPSASIAERRGSRSQTIRNESQPNANVEAATTTPEAKKERRGRPRKPDHLLKVPRIDPKVYQMKKAKVAEAAKAREANGEPPAVEDQPRKRGRPRKPDHLLMHPRVKPKVKA